MDSKPINLLLVEDSEDDAFLVTRHLRKGGFSPDVTRVTSESELRTALDNRPWDLMISDHHLPGFSSREAIRIVDEYDIDLPIIIVSGSIQDSVAVDAMKSGANDYVMKGDMARLVPAIERELREAKNRQSKIEAENEINYMAYHDTLTGLVNRAEFERRLGEAIASPRVHSVLQLDLYQFKIINNTCGHRGGDELLKLLAMRLNSRIRGKDTLARLGGDEFGILLEGCDIAQAEEVAREFIWIIQNFRFPWNSKSYSVGVCAGLAAIDNPDMTPSELLGITDIACAAAKEKGRNNIKVYQSDDREVSSRLGEISWVTRIDDALLNDHFVLYSQPIVPLSDDTDRPVLHEILLRMEQDDQLFGPDSFIPAAERYRRMSQIDRWVIAKAFELVSTLPETDSKGRKLIHSINLSGQSLGEDWLCDFVKEQLNRTGLEAGRICFEVTETAAISNYSVAIDFLNEARSFGCFIALDDFGSGLSSFAYLKSLPVDFLKIEGSFVKNIVEDEMDYVIVEAINAVGQKAGIRTIAEYVENEQICVMLEKLGVDFAQGWGIAKPAPMSEQDFSN